MAQDITLSLEENHVHFIKGLAEKKGITVSEIVDNYLALFQKIEEQSKTEKLHPAVAAVSGIVSTGRNETMGTIFE